MGYDTRHYEKLYQNWVDSFSAIRPEHLVGELSTVMRSKLTSIIASAQMLADELNAAAIDDPEKQELVEVIVESARYISVLLDAALETNQAKQSSSR